MKRVNSRFWRIVASAALCTAVTLPLTSSASAQGVGGLTADGAERVAPAPDTPTGAVTTGLTDFGAQLARLTADPARNWVASPLSIACAFSMARAGAGGETAAELDRAFGFPATGRDEAFNAVTRQVVPTDKRATALVGNALFAQRGAQVGKPFLGTLGAQYGSGVHTVDFHSPAALRAVNDWVRQQTAGRIPNLFDHLDRDTELVLANAVYLKADWRYPFTGAQPAPFTHADGRVSRVPTMEQETDLRYAEGPGWQAVELPYAHSDLAMRIMLPAAGRSPDSLLTARSMASTAAALAPEYVSLFLPKWDFSTRTDLVGPLTRLGVRSAFDPNRADFAGIRPGLFIDQAVHQADITVDEQGTTASAGTGISMMPTAGRVGPTRVVRADHPFAFAIVHRPTGVPLFVGHVADPA